MDEYQKEVLENSGRSCLMNYQRKTLTYFGRNSENCAIMKGVSIEIPEGTRARIPEEIQGRISGGITESTKGVLEEFRRKFLNDFKKNYIDKSRMELLEKGPDHNVRDNIVPVISHVFFCKITSETLDAS